MILPVRCSRHRRASRRKPDVQRGRTRRRAYASTLAFALLALVCFQCAPVSAQSLQRGESRGRGVKVAILDSGFRGYKEHLGKALPERVTARSFRKDGNLEANDSRHGILCAEIIHAVAPEAELLFAGWEPNHPTSFLQAVQWARLQGAKIISCSIVMPTWSDGEGNGPIHRELGKLLGDGSKPDDVLFFASAGNLANRHWRGAFAKGTGGFHVWKDGEIDNAVLPWGIQPASVELCGATGNDFELILYDDTTGRILDRAVAAERSEYRCAVTRVTPEPGHSYSIRVRAVRDRPGRFHLYVLGGSLGHNTAAGSIPFPGDSPKVVAVGAVDERGRRLSYSSCGPCSERPKPNFVACVPFQSSLRARPFTGTSAAAPQAAGIAALLWSQRPRSTAQQTRKAMRDVAIDLGPEGHDWETGHGLIRVPARR